jgi:ATP-dependent RNA helicase DHX37/DHR1
VQHAGARGGKITDLGRAMAAYPVSPRFAKMLAVGKENGCLPFVVAIVAGLSVGDPFVHENALDPDSDEEDGARAAELEGLTSDRVREKERRRDVRARFFKKHAAFDSRDSDMFKLLSAIGAYEHSPTAAFCAEYFLRPKAMQEIQQLRSQISAIAGAPLQKMAPPSDKERKILRQVLCAGFIDQVAVLESLASKKGSSAHASARGVPYRALGVPGPVYLHPSSVLFHHTPPDYVVFAEVVRTARVCLKGVTRVQGTWLAVLGRDMCTFSRPLETPGMRARSVSATEREVVVVPHFGDLGVDLPPVKRRQRREGTRWITLEE